MNIWLSYKLFERWNEEINEEKIIAAYAVAKRKPEKCVASSQGHPTSIFGKYLFERLFEI